jgi:hypothetical protein
MKSIDIRLLEMLIRVRQFCVSHADALPANSRAAELSALIVAAINDMETQASMQDSGKRATKEKTSLKKVKLDALREDLLAISRTARAMAHTTPGLDDKFRMPRSKGEQACLIAARTFATDAEHLKTEFIRRGLAATFIEDLKTKREAVEESIDVKAQKASTQVSATVAVSKAAERGRDAMQELDAIVRNVFSDDPAVLAEWESASHLERASRHAKTDTPPASTQPPPAKV